jgi:hypothetical protein
MGNTVSKTKENTETEDNNNMDRLRKQITGLIPGQQLKVTAVKASATAVVKLTKTECRDRMQLYYNAQDLQNVRTVPYHYIDPKKTLHTPIMGAHVGQEEMVNHPFTRPHLNFLEIDKDGEVVSGQANTAEEMEIIDAAAEAYDTFNDSLCFYDTTKTWRTQTEKCTRYVDEIHRVWPHETILNHPIIQSNDGGCKCMKTLKADGKNLAVLGIKLLAYGPAAMVKKKITLMRMGRAEHLKNPSELDKLQCSVIHHCFVMPQIAFALETRGASIYSHDEVMGRTVGNIMNQYHRKLLESGTWSHQFALDCISSPNFGIFNDNKDMCRGIYLPYLRLLSLFTEFKMSTCTFTYAEEEELGMVNKDYNEHFKLDTFLPNRKCSNKKGFNLAEMKKEIRDKKKAATPR